MPRAANTEGTVKETPRKGSGVWMALLPPRLSTPGQRAAIPGRFPTKREARRALSAYIADVDRGLVPRPVTSTKPTPTPRAPKRDTPPSSAVGAAALPTIKELVLEYIDARKNNPRSPLATRTARGYETALRLQICHPQANIGAEVALAVGGQHIENWLDDLASAGVGAGTADAARRLLRSALTWQVAQGRLPFNAVSRARKYSTKASRAAAQTADPVLLPSWSELAALVSSPTHAEDRLLIALLAWTGLRWSEAASLGTYAVSKVRPELTVDRVLMKRTAKEREPGDAPWVVEPPKGGLAATVPLPRPLWIRLLELVDMREAEPPLPEPAGRLLFRPASPRIGDTESVGMLDNRCFLRDVWSKARVAAHLVGDPRLPEIDPRHWPIKVKDLRAFAVSGLYDAGGNELQASQLLRHSDTRTTRRYYMRAMDDASADPQRSSLRQVPGLSLQDRIDLVWNAWVSAHPAAAISIGIEPNIGDSPGD